MPKKKIEGYESFSLRVPPEELADMQAGNENKIDAYKSLVEEIDRANDPKEADKAIRKAQDLGFKPGVKVLLQGEDVGEVVGYNKEGGFYPTKDYPVVVKSDRGIFEYGLDDLELLD